MNRSWCLILFLVLSQLEARAQTSVSAPPKKVSAPLFLKSTDKIPSERLSHPRIPQKGKDGTALEANGDVYAPTENVLLELSDPAFLGKTQGARKKETQINRVYWHADGGVEYCHFRDEEGNHWYGWNEGPVFHWILWQGRRYWWRDDFAGHWFYYAGNNWWRADLQTPDQIQVLIQGEYYLCQKDGTILKDMGQDGTGGIISGNGPFRGDSHHGGHGHGSGHSGKGAQANPATANPGTAPSN